MFHSQIFGAIVRELREMALAGASPLQLLDYLAPKCPPPRASRAFDYLGVAFLQSSHQLRYLMSRRDLVAGQPDVISEIVMEKRAQWDAQRFPELMRLRDYFAFLRFAVENKLVVMVCAANRFAGRYVDLPGFDCYDGRSIVVSREAEPNAGLIAADPTDRKLRAALQAFPTPLSYEEYVGRLLAEGLRVLGAEEGYVLVSNSGHRQYEGYHVHSVCDDRGESAWRGQDAERLRAALNRALGSDLVRCGPHDDWEHRNSPEVAGPFCGPQFPVVAFLPDGQIDNYFSSRDFPSAPFRIGWLERYQPVFGRTPEVEGK